MLFYVSNKIESSSGKVKFLTGGIVRDEPKRLSIRRNSETDSIVWMEEDGKDFCYAFTAPKDMFFGCRFLSPSVTPKVCQRS